MRGAARRSLAWILALSLVATACSLTEPSVAPGTPPPSSGSAGGGAATTIESFGTAAGASTSTSTSTSTTGGATLPDRFEYFVVAEEDGRRLAVVAPAAVCADPAGPCDVAVTVSVELPQRPHNLAAVGSAVFATHPAAGSISRVDLVGGEVVTIPLGREPHDIKYDAARHVLYVADESGRRLLTLDPDALELVEVVDLPGEPHDLTVDGDVVWVTLLGRTDLARITGSDVELVPTGGSPHDLIVAADGSVWFSNWGSPVLSVFDPATAATAPAPAGATEPHHFALGVDGSVWVSDNGGSAIVGFTDPQIAVEVGPVPHHMVFSGDTVVVAVSGSGHAVQVRQGQVVGRTELTPGLHGVAVVVVDRPLGS